MASVYHLKWQNSINEAKNKVDIVSTHSNRKKKQSSLQEITEREHN